VSSRSRASGRGSAGGAVVGGAVVVEGAGGTVVELPVAVVSGEVDDGAAVDVVESAEESAVESAEESRLEVDGAVSVETELDVAEIVHPVITIARLSDMASVAVTDRREEGARSSA
jgi:hypothetical protein